MKIKKLDERPMKLHTNLSVRPRPKSKTCKETVGFFVPLYPHKATGLISKSPAIHNL